MSQQLYYELRNLLNDFDSLDKIQIKNKLEEIIDILKFCPECKSLADPIIKYGKELDPSTRYDAAEMSYTLCPECKYVYRYGYN